MDSILFLTSKGVVEMWRNNEYQAYGVYLDGGYIGSVLNNSRFHHHNEEKPVFDEKEKQLLVEIALKRVIPSSLIIRNEIRVNSETWSVERYTKKTFRVKCSIGAHRGLIWQEYIDGRLMWVSDKIETDILLQIAPQMLTLKKRH